ncbi:hypothetical protein CYMTET_43668 [Cymbomonas tetramitiformis]|uniref:Condensin complex subunit 3 n=1 Tax=Cymbomonas tetramitiformis TaxID=36881 RepID=A0AAE0C307_9CHLO|nr:hypothetical protein CYMTET_43668 [Cymbomonas tetramitiformis]
MSTLSVAQVFNECQASVTLHKKCAHLLSKRRQETPDVFFNDFCACLKHVLLVQKGDADAERVVKFVTTFATARESGNEDICDEFLENTLSFLLDYVTATDKTVRYRVCQIIAGILNDAGETEISDDLLERIQLDMTKRVRDKFPPVRVHAIRSLARLQDSGEEGDFREDPVTALLEQVLLTERSKDVRKAALGSIGTSDFTLEMVVERTKDINEEVRRIAFMVLREKLSIKHLSMQQRATVLQRGLLDRDLKVQKECRSLLFHWLQESNDDPVVLLRALDVETHEAVAERVLQELFTEGGIKPVHVALTQASQGLRNDKVGVPTESGVALLDTETVLFWRVLCEYLHRAAQERGTDAATACGTTAVVAAASAGDLLEALEAALPATVATLFDLVAAYAAAGSERHFAARQLLRLTRCLELADTTGRQAAMQLLHRLLGEPPVEGSFGLGGDESWERALVDAASLVYDAPSTLHRALLESALAMALPQAAVEGEGSTAISGEVAEGGPEDEARVARWMQSLLLVVLALEGAASEQGLRGAARGSSMEDESALLLERVMSEVVLPAVQNSAAPLRREGLR